MRSPNTNLLAEIEDLIRTRPQDFFATDDETLSWLGRACNAVNTWASHPEFRFGGAITTVANWNAAIDALGDDFDSSSVVIKRTLYQIQSHLRFLTGPINTAIGQEQPFLYFDTLRKIIEEASSDVFFVDPYLNADFVSRYLPHVRDGVSIRLLGREKITALRSAAAAFGQEHQRITIEVRSSDKMHDRWVFIDKKRCFLSGASFKDGASRTTTIITENVDAFAATYTTYENLWQGASA